MTPPASVDAPLHPRPMLARRLWLDLGGPWSFRYDDEDAGLDAGFSAGFDAERTIVVPFPPESPASGVGEPGAHRIVWYQREVTAVELDSLGPAPRRAGQGEGAHVAPGPGPAGTLRTILHVGACDYEATVWCNGVLVGRHEGGHTPFSCDLTAALSPDGPQRLVVRALDDPDDASQPRGKQDWRAEAHAIWYPRTTGLWQPVWIERVAARHLSALSFVTCLERSALRATVRIASRPVPGDRLAIAVRHGKDVVAAADVALGGEEATVELALPVLDNPMERERLLWSPESPTLLDVTVELRDNHSACLDAVESYAGLREVALEGGRMLLNGRPYFQRLALEQGVWPESHLAAPSPEALRAEVELAKELGFNGVRIHQKIEDPRFLTWCDRLGLLVWEEMPSAYHFGTVAMRRTVAEWTEAVERDRSHPCIVCWVPLNESWGVPDLATSEQQRRYAAGLAELTRALDPTRPVISNDGWEHVDSDIWSIHDYAPDGATLRRRYGSREAIAEALADVWPGPKRPLLCEDPRATARWRPLMVTEFGGLSVRPGPGEPWFGYATLADDEELAQRFEELVGALLDCEGVVGFCYTQFSDTFQERNGIVDERRRPKVPPARVRAALGRPAASMPEELVHAARRRQAEREPGN